MVPAIKENKMRNSKMVTAIFLTGMLTACSAPDVSTQVTALTDGFETAEKELSVKLAPKIQSEEQALMRAAVKARRTPLRLSPDCAAYRNRVAGADLEKCKIIETVLNAPPAAGTARRAEIQLVLLDDYFSALAALAASKSPADIAVSAGLLIDAFDGLSKTDAGAGLAKFAQDLSAKKEPIGTVARGLAEQYRLNVLRRVVRDANDAVGTTVDILVAYYDAHTSKAERDAFKALETAEKAVVNGRKSASVDQQLANIANLRSALKDYKALASKSPVQTLLTLKSAHAALVARLQDPGDPKQVLAYLKQLKSFSDAVEAL